MASVTVDNLRLEYDMFGEREAPRLLLSHGLGVHMLSWPDDFCRVLAGRGFCAIRYDSRDTGRSTRLDELGFPTDLIAILRGQAEPPYTLDDMADDAVGLLDGLGIASAHCVGASMGGVITQLIAIRHPRHVLSMTSIMASPGALRDQTPGSLRAIKALLTPPPEDRGALVEHLVSVSRILAGPLFDETEQRCRVSEALDHGVSLAGARRQLAALAAAPSRVEALGLLTGIPALIIHGEADPLVPAVNGRRTAEAIQGARLLTLPDMGHDLPRQLWPEIADAIAALAGRPVDATPP